jgi:hypothetical protein
MMKGLLSRSIPAFLILAGLCGAETPRRIHGEIRDDETFRLTGHTRPIIALAQDEGEVSSAQELPRLALHFAMSTQQGEDLDQLLRQQQARDAAQYHKFLTPEEFGARFGPNAQDVAQVTAWLQSQGFSDVQVARSRTFVSFTGTAGQAQSAFHTAIHRYTYNGETHFANASDPLLPKALEGVVGSVRGLHDFRKKPRGIRKLSPRFTSSIPPNAKYLTPDDFATIYNVQPLYQAGLDGTGVKIAIAGQSDIQLSDIRAFRAAAGLPANDPTIIVNGTDPGIQSNDAEESDLDIEWAGGIARNATIVFVTSKNVDDSITYAIDNNVAPILSLSYGSCETQLTSAESNTEAIQYRQANAQGMTVTAPSGDSGAADCDYSDYPAHQGLSVDEPASFPYVTGVGGTTFNEGTGTYWNTTNNSYGGSALSYIPEVAWNDTSQAGKLSASGGGASVYNAKPVWQTGTGVPNDGKRDVPDLSFTTSPDHDPLLICSAGKCVNGFRDANQYLDAIGGTSASSPSFAAIVALLVQALGPQGNVNPQLYALAASSPATFHDITSGNNIVPCRAGSLNCTNGILGYSAGIGYDQVTGLGSLDAYRLISEWTVGAPATVGAASGPLTFVPISPCRVVDTRGPNNAFGGPALVGLAQREFDLPSGGCSIPVTALAYALNVTVAPSGPLQYLSIWPTGPGKPVVSTLNSDGRIKANAAIVPAGTNGGIEVYATNPTQLILDVTGYFVPTVSATGLQFFPVTPCRAADTRAANGNLGGPYLTGAQARDFPIPAGACNVPASAQAYSLNLTVVPHGPLIYLSAWPAGQSIPSTSVVNAPTGSITANAAIVPAGTNGSITALGSSDTDLVIDINGYFAPPATGGLNFYTLTPCRVLDTRNPAGSLPFSGALPVNVTTSGCGSPATAQAYALNATVVPSGPLQYLSLWPANEATPPTVSTLNADPNTVTSNLAILPGAIGLVNAYASQATYLILDISGYFAP